RLPAHSHRAATTRPTTPGPVSPVARRRERSRDQRRDQQRDRCDSDEATCHTSFAQLRGHSVTGVTVTGPAGVRRRPAGGWRSRRGRLTLIEAASPAACEAAAPSPGYELGVAGPWRSGATLRRPRV